MAYHGDNILEIKSHRQNACRAQLSRQNLQIFQSLEGWIGETIAQKTTIDRPVLMNQLDQIATYLKAGFFREKISNLKEITLRLARIHNDFIILYVPTSNAKPNFIYDVITFTAV